MPRNINKHPIVDEDAYRIAVGSFATGVTVVTMADGDTPLGFTCQSFVSLSLNPRLISISVSRESRTWPRLGFAGPFCVNVLGVNQGILARRFATPDVDRFSGTAWRPSAVSGAPRLAGAGAWIDAQVDRTYPVGDHHLVVGRVMAAEVGEEAEPLLYHRSNFSALRQLS
ncbi:flavin reductase family protein [Streptomyces sp. H23]|uniref:flavin reductase family protein n=1 Tax=Streptomyces sp. H23 TaxID=2541723 RepID=UPI00106EF60C|nr:flavin reductase family protein [Streptomyces sp. H23]